ncbi:MAG: hypothetical protein IJP82_03270 [Bacteroidaceae bacterium]|nr:hypothetical protein [Bacteroidaceae bacterium]
MKTNVLAIALMVANLLLMACNNNPKTNSEPVESDNMKDVVTATPADTIADNDPASGIVAIRKAWTDTPIKVSANTSTPGIEQFALAFCKAYPQIETNKVLRDYLLSPTDYKNELYGVYSHPNDGFLRCLMLVETVHETMTCYWNRKNGHKLFAAFMEERNESGKGDCLAVFYDYNPATDIMTPEPAQTDMIEQRMKKYDNYSLILPQEGKDITVYGYIIDEEMDNADSKELTLKWNGLTFEWDE